MLKVFKQLETIYVTFRKIIISLFLFMMKTLTLISQRDEKISLTLEKAFNVASHFKEKMYKQHILFVIREHQT